MSVFDKRILIINPAYNLRGEVRTALNDRGFLRIDEAGDGLEAIQMLNQQDYALIITDIDIQNLDAWRLARLVRSGMLKTSAQSKIVVLSSTYAERIAEATSKEFEINLFIPVNQSTKLVEQIVELLSSDDDALPKSTMLVVEDYQDTAELINRILHKRFDITFAQDGETGLKLWQQQQHDIVLLDLMLPNISGEQVLKSILKQKPTQSVVMMTAHGDSKNATDLVIAGAVDFIAKPFKAERLRHVCNIAAHREDFVVSNEQFKDKQRALTKEQNRAEITLRSIGDGVITTDHLGSIDYINPVAENLLKYSYTDVIGKPLSDIYSTLNEASRIPTVNFVKRAINEKTIQRSIVKSILKNRDGEELLVEQEAAPILNELGIPIGAVLVFRDRTEEKNIERKLSYHASHDPLTGLHNRDVFDQEIRLAMHEANTNESEHALCHLSISQFNIINASCGHAGGDKLLQKIANFLKQKVRAPSDVVARIGGHEFGILLRHCNIETADRICNMIVSELIAKPFDIDEKSFEINLSIGIVSVTAEAKDLRELVSSATTACNMAKERGKNKVASFTSQDIDIIERRTEVLFANDLMAAIQTDRVKLFQQRIYNQQGLDSFEILIRVTDENGQLLPPGPYLMAAERYNLTQNLDRWVIDQTFSWLEQNIAVCHNHEYISINLSGLSICDDTFTAYIIESFDKYAVPPTKICFEVTETAAISNFSQATEFIVAIKSLGCKFALDDFGSGMSSFAYLKNLPVDILKIDGMFVKDIVENPVDYAMVKSINDVGHVMGLKTVAEYVENRSILDTLKALGVDAYQGYAIAKPASIEELLKDVRHPQKLRQAG